MFVLFQQSGTCIVQIISLMWSLVSVCRCAGLCKYEGRGGLCSVHLSTPLLKLRPRKDLIETLLVRMSIHIQYLTYEWNSPEVYIFKYWPPCCVDSSHSTKWFTPSCLWRKTIWYVNVTYVPNSVHVHYMYSTVWHSCSTVILHYHQDHDGHGPKFQFHMNRINKASGTNITVSLWCMVCGTFSTVFFCHCIPTLSFPYGCSCVCRFTTHSTMKLKSTANTGGDVKVSVGQNHHFSVTLREQWTELLPHMTPGGGNTSAPVVGRSRRSKSPKTTKRNFRHRRDPWKGWKGKRKSLQRLPKMAVMFW